MLTIPPPRSSVPWLILFATAGACAVAVARAESQGIEYFEKKVRPILVERCYECHSAAKGKTKGGLALDSREALLTGGDSGPALVAGDPENSKLIDAVRYQNHDLQMPPKRRLAPQQVADLEAWVKMGAPDPREKVAATGGIRAKRVINIAEGRKFWSFRPIGDPAVPKVKDTAWVKTPVDAFVLAKLEEKGLHPSGPADKRTLIRRATFDLIGLPPTPDEVDAFIRDASPDAFSRVVERLLRSPAYGERWGRHWLDVARYADSNGMDENVCYGNAWRYRDYVIQAFNDDKPYDRFVIEQLAGDLLPAASPAERIENLTATGFLALGGKVLAEPDVRKMQMDVIDEEIDTMGRAFLGMTFGCVRCHDHKFDPIQQTDYYSMAAIFRGTKSLGDDNFGAIKYWYEHSLATPEQQAEKKAYEAKVAGFTKKVAGYVANARHELKEELQSHAAEYLAAAAQFDADADYAIMERVAAAHHLRPRYLAACRQYLARHPQHPFFSAWHEMVKSGHADEVAGHYGPLFAEALASWKTAKAKDAKAAKLNDPRLDAALAALNDIAGFLAIPDKEADAFDAATLATVNAMNTELMNLDQQTPDPPALMGVADGTVTKTLPIHLRGSYLTLGKEVERGFPEVMRTSLVKTIFPSKQSGRLELARWIASPEHPLTARIIVNRAWCWHFGKGIVASTDNFGTLGDRPSHPELLDWLARHFIEDGWSIKDLHRWIMNSAAYQQSSSPADLGAGTAGSSPDPRLEDPENRLLWRFNVQRLEAEEIRDALLSVSGRLDTKVGGKTVPLRDKEFVFNHTSKDHTTYESPRRALYVPIIRNHLYDVLEQFDYPDPTVSTSSRHATVVAPQALLMMNAPITMNAANRLAVKMLASNVKTEDQRIENAYLTIYGRPPHPPEIKRAAGYLAALQKTVAATGTKGEACREQSWAVFCQTLLASNEFMYLR